MSVVLVRAIGRAAMTGLVVNIIIGRSVFGLPGELQRLLGPASPLVMLAGALCIAVFAACAAELDTGRLTLHVRYRGDRRRKLAMGRESLQSKTRRHFRVGRARHPLRQEPRFQAIEREMKFPN